MVTVKRTRSMKNCRNNVKILMEITEKEACEDLENAVKEALNKWSRLLRRNLSYEVVFIKPK